MYLTDEAEPVSASGRTKWYDARENHPDRSEYRLYYQSSAVSAKFVPDDLLIIALRPDGTLLITATPQGSSIGDQLLWLFGLDSPNGQGSVRGEPEIDRDVDYVVRWILEAVGIEAAPPTVDAGVLLERFGDELPTTRVFSEFAREQTVEFDTVGNADQALMAWLETEERYFRAFERLLVEERLRLGFVDVSGAVDVNGFVSFSLSVQNRRKSRAGHSFEHHLEQIFSDSGLLFERGATTEKRSKPDFLFPSSKAYFDVDFLAKNLSMLGAKSTCKDRWRQVTAEADRIESKHLVTLEPSISLHQTNEMKSRNVQLILPHDLHRTYSVQQQEWLWTIGDFIEHIRTQQR